MFSNLMEECIKWFVYIQKLCISYLYSGKVIHYSNFALADDQFFPWHAY